MYWPDADPNALLYLISAVIWSLYCIAGLSEEVAGYFEADKGRYWVLAFIWLDDFWVLIL